MCVLEHDLNLEIDRLVQTSTMQKRRIAELECQMMSTRLEGKSDGEIDSDSQYKKCCKSCEKCKKCRKHRTPSVHDIVSSAKVRMYEIFCEMSARLLLRRCR